MIVAGALSLLMIVGLGVQAPAAIGLGLVPLVIVAPVLMWLDRVEPEPWPARIHALLWGATVAVVIAGTINSIVAVAWGETAAAVLSAPIVEETAKAFAIVYAVRRRELDGVMDGVVYAGWSALGFAVVEDFLYFATAEESGVLVETFILRALLTPFAHPLFTTWTGLAIGLAVSRGRPVFPSMLWGLGLAIATHMAWNGALSLGEVDGGSVVALAALLFVVLFIAGMISLIVVRRSQQKRFVELVPWLAQRYGMAQSEVSVFGHWSSMWSARRALSRSGRKDFDAVHAALARLAHLHDRPGPTDLATEQVLAAQLYRARQKVSGRS